MISSSPNSLPSKTQPSTPIRYLLRSWLPIIIVGIIIFYLSGGFPPTVWILLSQMLSRWKTLQATQGSAVFIPLCILVVQCVLLLIAWSMLLVVIVREVSSLRKQQDQTKSARLQMGYQAVGNTSAPAVATPPLPANQVATPHNPWYDQVSSPLAPDPTQAKNRGLRVEEDALDNNPFSSDLLIQAQAKSRGLRVDTEQPDGMPANPFEDDTLTPTQTKSRSVRISQAADNLFDLFSESDKPADEEEPADEEDAPFVYGNPFEGELPEVFRYDMDLRKSVLEIRDEQSTTDPDKGKAKDKVKAKDKTQRNSK